MLRKMLKIFIIFGILAFTSAETETERAQRFCDTENCSPGESIACQYTTDPDIKCDGYLLPIDLEEILDIHNNYRDTVANGDLSPYEEAQRMAEMRIHPNLTKMAEYNVKTCVFAHDQCRNTDEFPYSGQNLAARWQKGISNWDWAEEIRQGVASWFSEHTEADMSYIDSYHDSPETIGHFTVMVKDSNNYLGCAASRFTDDDGWDTILLACNYAQTNIYDQPIYVSGPTASACTSGISTEYSGLCSINEVY